MCYMCVCVCSVGEEGRTHAHACAFMGIWDLYIHSYIVDDMQLALLFWKRSVWWEITCRNQESFTDMFVHKNDIHYKISHPPSHSLEKIWILWYNGQISYDGQPWVWWCMQYFDDIFLSDCAFVHWGLFGWLCFYVCLHVLSSSPWSLADLVS